MIEEFSTKIIDGRIVGLRTVTPKPGICKPCHDGEHKRCYGDMRFMGCVCRCRNQTVEKAPKVSNKENG
jgi:hypothetical protein